MANDLVAGFWSYANDDNHLDDGAILELARLIMAEYDLLSGEPLQLFIDRNDIAWGDEWRSRIDSALTQTTFFIPIITPRYFVRQECRRELLEFAAKAKSLGVEELLLPILYVKPQGFSSDSPDEAVALVARTQYVDWQSTRLLEPRSRDYRAAINTLARRLVDIAGRVAESQLRQEIDTVSRDNDNYADGIAEIVDKVTKLLPDWHEAVMGEKVNRAQIFATADQRDEQVRRLRRAKAPASAILAAEIRTAKELLPLAERAQKDGRIYVSRSVELDPLISALARLITEHPDSFDLVMPIREAIDEAILVVHEMDRVDEHALARSYHTFFSDLKHAGRIFQKSNAIFTDAERLAKEGNNIVRRWDGELKRMPESEQPSPPAGGGQPALPE